MKFVVDRIERDIAILENLDTKDKRDVEIVELPVVREGDVLVFEDGLYQIDNKEREERMRIIREKLNKLKRNK